MKPAPFSYVRARTLAEAAELLAAGVGEARILAGGQSLGPTLNLRLARPAKLIDIKRAEGFRDLAADDATIRIGAGFTHAEIEDGRIEDPSGGLLRYVAGGIAYRAVRNRGTLGGSLAHADPAADWVSTVIAAGASIMTRAAATPTRIIAAEAFFRGAFATALTEDEVLAAVVFPRRAAARWGYAKLCRKVGEFAHAIGVAVLDERAGFARIIAGALDGAPVMLPESAAVLLGEGVDAAHACIEAELDALLAELPATQRRVHAVVLRRALAGIAQKGTHQ